MNKCICGEDIFPTSMFAKIGECMCCHRLYRFKENKWLEIDRGEFRELYRITLIEKQLSNKGVFQNV